MKRIVINESQYRLISESFDFSDYLFDYDETYVLDCFKQSGGKGVQNWGVLINPSMYQKALSEYTKYGSLTKFPVKYLYQWMGIIARNTCILAANTNLAGHGSTFDEEAVENFLMDYFGDKIYNIEEDNVRFRVSEEEFLDLCEDKGLTLNESNGIHRDGQYDLFMNQDEVDEYDREREKFEIRKKFERYAELAERYNKSAINEYGIQTDNISVSVEDCVIYREKSMFSVLDEIGLYDWMKMPDGSDAWSDFGLSPIYSLLDKYDDNLPPEEILVLINKILDVYHQRGDLSSIFVNGGTYALSKVSNGEVID